MGLGLAIQRRESWIVAILPGTRLGQYEIHSLLGTGGMGEVYRALDVTLQRPVALKFLRSDLTTDAGRLLRFEREASAVSSLNHPNILTIYEIRHAPPAEADRDDNSRQRLALNAGCSSAVCSVAINVARSCCHRRPPVRTNCWLTSSSMPM